MGHNTGTGAIDAALPWCPRCAARYRAEHKKQMARRAIIRGVVVLMLFVAIVTPPLMWNGERLRSTYQDALYALVVLTGLLLFARVLGMRLVEALLYSIRWRLQWSSWQRAWSWWVDTEKRIGAWLVRGTLATIGMTVLVALTFGAAVWFR